MTSYPTAKAHPVQWGYSDLYEVNHWGKSDKPHDRGGGGEGSGRDRRWWKLDVPDPPSLCPCNAGATPTCCPSCSFKSSAGRKAQKVTALAEMKNRIEL